MPKIKVTPEHITEIWTNSSWTVETILDKCTLVTCTLPNGFIIIESSACVDIDNYDEQIGYEVCKERIINKIWELEGYLLQERVYKNEL